jgi:hypothetical protein
MLRRRTSAGSRPSALAIRSIVRSMASAASGRPAPRYGAFGTLLVAAMRAAAAKFAILYGPSKWTAVLSAIPVPTGFQAPQSTRMGVVLNSAPNTESASETAFAITAGGATAPPSPTPLTPNGLSGEGEWLCSKCMSGMSLARGSA